MITCSTGGLIIELGTLMLRGGNLGGWHQASWFIYLAGLTRLIIAAMIGFTFPR